MLASHVCDRYQDCRYMVFTVEGTPSWAQACSKGQVATEPNERKPTTCICNLLPLSTIANDGFWPAAAGWLHGNHHVQVQVEHCADAGR